jgi:hypothetical protein
MSGQRDWRGHLYDVGSTVLYPRQSGHSVEMCEAEVVKIEAHIEPEPRYEQWDAFSDRKKAAEAAGFSAASLRRLQWTEDVEHVTVWLLPQKTSRFGYMGTESKREAKASALARGVSQEDADRWYADQKPVKITITKNITVI